MFGYVLADKSNLSEAQFQRYRSCYCGLCHEIGRSYGSLQRLALNYDMAFLVLLLTSLYEPEERQDSVRCVVHPWKPHDHWLSPCTSYGAAMNVALAYYQRMDRWQDDHSLLSRAEAQLFAGAMGSIRAVYPRQMEAITVGLDALRKLEQADLQDPDQGANAFGALLAELFVFREDRWEPLLRQLGASLGRAIYLMDALLDLPADLKHGSYNPLRSRAQAGLTKEAFLPVLQLLMGECTDAFERLPLVQDVELMRNILYSGFWLKYHQSCRKDKEATHV